MRHGRLLFDGMPRRDAVSWNTLIAGYSSAGSPRLALAALRDARGSGVCADKFTYAAVLGACAGASGRAAHGLAVVSGHARTAFVANSVMDMYSRCGMIDEVRLVFDLTEERDEVSWNLLLSAYVRMGWPEVAVNVLVWMHRSGARLDAFTLGGIVKACSQLEDSDGDVRKMLHGCVVKVGLDLNVFVGSAMVDIYAKNGGLEEAIKVFDFIPDQNVVVYNAMIAGFARLGNDPCPEVRTEALRLFSNLLQRIRPSKFTFKSVLEVCNLTSAVRCGRQIHTHVIISGFESDEYIANALVNLYSKARLVDDSLRCFYRTPKQEILTWTSMITAFVQDGQFEKALDLFRELRYTEKEPDQFTISSVMNACAGLNVPVTCEQIHCYAVKAGFDQFTVCGNSQIVMYRNVGDLKAAKKTFEKITCLDTFSWSQMVLSYAVHGHGREALLLFETMQDRGVMIDEFAFLAILIACSHQGLTDEGFRYPFFQVIFSFCWLLD
jgi:pentatricopeptide repeat protein